MKLPPREGPVVKVTHFNTLTESLLVYGTHAGKIHGWDLRAKKEVTTSNQTLYAVLELRRGFYP